MTYLSGHLNVAFMQPGPDIVAVGPVAREADRPPMLSCARCIEGKVPQHFDVLRSTMSQQHGYNTRNGYML